MKSPAKKTAPKSASAKQSPVKGTPTKAARKTASKKSTAARSAAKATSGPELELSEVVTLAKMGSKKGNLTEEEIQAAISDIDLSDDQVDNVYAHFKAKGIEVLDEPVELPPVAAAVVAPDADDDEDDKLPAQEKEHINIPLPKPTKAGQEEGQAPGGCRARSAHR